MSEEDVKKAKPKDFMNPNQISIEPLNLQFFVDNQTLTWTSEHKNQYLTSNIDPSICSKVDRPSSININDIKQLEERIREEIATEQWKQNMNHEIKTSVIQSMSSTEIIQQLLIKIGRYNHDKHFAQKVLDYITRHTISVFNEELTDRHSFEDSHIDWLDLMKQELLDINGIKNVQVIVDDYPQLVSMIIKIDMNGFDEDEAYASMGQLITILETFKPKQLQELEVIYHNKVVYY